MKQPLMMVNLLSGVYWFDDALQASLRRAGWDIVTRSQSLLFANIAAGEDRPTRLARRLGVTRQAISQMLADLEARGVLVTTPDPHDKRARVVRFTRKSLPLRDAAYSVLLQLEAELERRLGSKVHEALDLALRADWGDLPEVEPRAAATAAPAQPSDAKKKPA